MGEFTVLPTEIAYIHRERITTKTERKGHTRKGLICATFDELELHGLFFGLGLRKWFTDSGKEKGVVRYRSLCKDSQEPEQVERGWLNPPDDVLEKICEVLRLDVEEAKRVRALDKEAPVMSLMGVNFHLTR